MEFFNYSVEINVKVFFRNFYIILGVQDFLEYDGDVVLVNDKFIIKNQKIQREMIILRRKIRYNRKISKNKIYNIISVF